MSSHTSPPSDPALTEDLQKSLDRAMQKLALAPNDPALHNALGIMHGARGDIALALQAFNHAIALEPSFAEALDSKGHILEMLGRPEEALTAFTAAASLTPHYEDAEARIAALSSVLGRAVPQSPWRPSWRRRLKSMLIRRPPQATKDRSEGALRERLAEDPRDIDAAFALGRLLQARDRQVEAQHFFRYTLVLAPSYGRAAVALAESFRATDQTAQAAEVLAAYRSAADDDVRLLPSLLRIKSELCDWRDYEQVHTAARRAPQALDPFTAWSQWDDPALHAATVQAFMAEKTAGVVPMALAPRPPSPRLTLGYISADFHQNASASLWSELFELHDRERFRIVGYSLWADDRSARRARIVSAFDGMTNLWAVPVDAAVRKIASDHVDILIDLTGLLRNARPRILAHRPAPVLVSYPGSTGSTFIDYAIADPVVAPAGHEQWYTEKLVRLPDTYQINDRKRPRPPARARASYGLPEKGTVFSSFSTSSKITPEVFHLWMDILRAVPGSIMWLRGWSADVEDNLRRECGAHAIDPGRLIFAGNCSYEEHLARYRVVDLALDTLNLGGHATVSDALWMGCPVVTCTGKSFVSRVGTSLLRAAGLPELAVSSPTEYVALAVSLAHAPAVLQGHRGMLEVKRSTCALFDSPKKTRQLEWAYQRMWDIHTVGGAPQAFDVPADLP